jgi:stage II sporulation protein D
MTKMRRIATTAPIALLAALVAAAPAGAASKLTIRGAGFGHGIGMSQYGAYGMAKHGWTHDRILGHYFSGTQLGQAPAGAVVRVLLQSPKTATFTGATNAGTKELDAGKVYGARTVAGGQIRLVNAAGRKIATFDAPLRVTNSADEPIKLRGTAGNGVTDGTYRGWLEFRPGALGEVLAINAVGLEQYVAGVVANEAVASWPMEALEAQAVAARSYAITTSRAGENGWDQYPDTRSQVYRGVVGEHPNTNRAVNGTAGQVVTYKGQPVTAFFFSTSGGRTESVENAWPGATPKPYLKSVDDPYDDVSPYHRWGPISKSRGEVEQALKSLVKGRFKRIEVTRRGGSPRIVEAVVVGSNGRTTVSGEQLKQRFGLRDTWMTFNSVITEVETPPDTPQPPAPSGPTPKAPEQGNASGGAVAARMHRARVVGEAWPGRRGTRVTLQRLDGRRWVGAGRTRLGHRRRYKIALPGPGRYRVLVGAAAGPTVRLGA